MLPDGWGITSVSEDDKPNGQGTYTFPDGREFIVGESKDGNRNGH